MHVRISCQPVAWMNHSFGLAHMILEKVVHPSILVLLLATLGNLSCEYDVICYSQIFVHTTYIEVQPFLGPFQVGTGPLV